MKLTIFTPLYNRREDVKRLYQSLLEQSVTDFEWLVIDDGSKDHPEEVFSEIMKENHDFEIVFLSQPNGGKHRAMNRAFREARGEYFVVCDSDDYFTTGAIDTIFTWLDEIQEETHLSGVAGLKISPDGELLLWDEREDGSICLYGGKPVFSEPVDANFFDILQYGMRGDRCEIFKTDVIRKYPLPEYEKENFATEGIMYNRMIRDDVKLRWYTKPLEVCEYMEGGLTQNGLQKFIDNPKGYALYIREDIGSEEEKENAFYDYYLRLKDRLSLKEIAENLGVQDLSFFDYMREKRQQERTQQLQLMKEVLNTRKNLQAAGEDLYHQMEPQLKSLLKKGLRHSNEGDFLFTDTLDEAERKLLLIEHEERL